jgi:hypothetical protein
VAYGCTPWILCWIGRLSGEVPFPSTSITQVRARVVGLGVLVAVVASVDPTYLLVVPLAGVGLLAGSIVAGRARRSLRLFGVAIAATVVAFILLFPWSGSVSRTGVAFFGPKIRAPLGFGQILRFHTGPFGGNAAGFAILAVAALPLFVGRGWRLAWAARLWSVAVISLAVAWAGTRGWFPAIPVETALAPAAAALAGSAALGAAAFELDLPGYRFGWRQLAAAAAVAGLAVASVPLFAASSGGRWKVPKSDAGAVLAFLPDSHAGDYRVLWVGAPGALPLASLQLETGVGYATSFDGEPTVSDLWQPGPTGATPHLAQDLHLVEHGLTTKFGHLLAIAGVRYLVIPNHDSPSGSGSIAEPVPSALLVGLGLQTDLQIVDVGDPNYVVYENAAWAPARMVLPPAGAAVAGTDEASAQRLIQETDLRSGHPVLTGAAPSRLSGTAPVGQTVYVASTRSNGWRLRTGGAKVPPVPAFGWAMSFAVPAGVTGTATQVTTLSFSPSLGSRVAQQIELILWAAAVLVVVADMKRRRSRGVTRETVDPEWFTPLAVAAPDASTRRSATVESGGDDEVWIDV